MRVKHGWIYREPGMGATPPRIKVSLGKNEEKVVKVFEDNAEGAQQAADYISAEVGDSWKLEDCAFLGARIFTEFP